MGYAPSDNDVYDSMETIATKSKYVSYLLTLKLLLSCQSTYLYKRNLSSGETKVDRDRKRPCACINILEMIMDHNQKPPQFKMPNLCPAFVI